MPLFSRAELESALDLVRRFVPPTPQYAWPLLAKRTGLEVWVKHENHTPIGAFKVRGGVVYVDALMRSGRRPAGIISATRGNHGQSIAFAASQAGLPATIVVPRGNSVEKNAAMAAFGAELIVAGDDFDDSRRTAAQLAEQRGYHFIPAFHPDLVKGVASYALELFTAVADLDAVYVSIGMGSGICGLITVRDLLGLRTEIVGVVADNAPAVALSFESGRPTPTPSARTFADGMACREPDPQALDLIGRGAARIVRLGEDEIADAMRVYFSDVHTVAEGAGAAPLAGLLKERRRMAGKRVALILSGGNIDHGPFAEVLGGRTPVV